MDDCIFCKIVQGDIPSFKVYEDDKVFAFADINPILEGHTLIIPKAHAENIWEISDDDLAAIHRASKKIAAGIRQALDPAGIACLQLNGRAVNQVVMHYHFNPDSYSYGSIFTPSWKSLPLRNVRPGLPVCGQLACGELACSELACSELVEPAESVESVEPHITRIKLPQRFFRSPL